MPVSESSLRTYPVPGGNAEAIAKLLQEVYPAPSTRVVALGVNQIAVWADLRTHLQLAQQRPLAAGVTVAIPLTNASATKIAATLKSMFGEPKTGGPFIEADNTANSLLIRGSSEQVDEIKQVLARIGEGRGGTQGKNVRTIIIENGVALTVADALHKLLNQVRPDIEVIGPSVVQVLRKKGPDAKDARKGEVSSSIKLVAFGDRLIIATDDPELMALAVEIVRILLNTDARQSDFEVIRLKHRNAAEVSKVLDETFNGFAKRVERVRIIADPATNSLLIRAKCARCACYSQTSGTRPRYSSENRRPLEKKK